MSFVGTRILGPRRPVDYAWGEMPIKLACLESERLRYKCGSGRAEVFKCLHSEMEGSLFQLNVEGHVSLVFR